MAFSGGVFTRLYNWVTDRNNGIKILASRMDAEFDGMATGLSTCLLKDGTQTVTANIPMASHKFTGLAAGTTNGDSIRYEQLTALSGTYQPLDADLTALAGLTSAADKLPYFTGSAAAAVADFTAAGRALVDDASASAQRTTLGLGTIATQDANNVSISGGAVTGITDLAVADGGTASSTASGARSNLGAAASGANSDITSLTALASINGGQLAGFRNLLINTDGRINQRLPATNADDTYGHDRWNVLTQTGTIAVSTVTDAENGTPKMWRLTQSQASAQRMGYSQIIEGANCRHLRGKQVTLSGRIKFSLNAAIRYAILEWTGTEDAVTSDVVNDWTSSTYTGGNFFNSTTLNVLAVGSITPAAATLTDLTSLAATVGSSANNLIILIWTEGTAAQNATLDGALQFEQGSVATAREFRPFTTELSLCQRYFAKSYELATAPGTATVVSGIRHEENTGNTGSMYQSVRFPVQMRVSPTLTSYDAAGTSGKVFKGADGKTATPQDLGQNGFTGGTTDATSTSILFFQYKADAEL